MEAYTAFQELGHNDKHSVTWISTRHLFWHCASNGKTVALRETVLWTVLVQCVKDTQQVPTSWVPVQLMRHLIRSASFSIEWRDAASPQPTSVPIQPNQTRSSNSSTGDGNTLSLWYEAWQFSFFSFNDFLED